MCAVAAFRSLTRTDPAHTLKGPNGEDLLSLNCVKDNFKQIFAGLLPDAAIDRASQIVFDSVAVCEKFKRTDTHVLVKVVIVV